MVFLDSDLSNFSCQSILGLLGPLLLHREIGLVKAAFDRDRVDGPMEDAPGGRLTELFARPMLNAHWPDLAGFVQPLSGQFAARRSVLEWVPFCQGYGVDLALLIDVWRSEGLDALAQCDIGHLVHRNRSSSALGRAAAEILHACTLRLPLPRTSGVTGNDLIQFRRLGAGFVPLTTGLAVREHKPMILNEHYIRRWSGPLSSRRQHAERD